MSDSSERERRRVAKSRQIPDAYELDQDVEQHDDTDTRHERERQVSPRVLRFTGRTSPQVVAEQQKKLEAWIDQQGYRAASEPEIAGYDPPWTPGALRRNEILIRVLPE